MLSNLVKITVVLVWTVCMGWLIRYEAYPRFFDNTLQGYQDVVEELPQLMDNWMRVIADGKHVGYSHSSVDREQQAGDDRIVLKSLLFIRVDTGMEIENMRLYTDVVLDDRDSLQSFEFGGNFGSMSGRVEGERVAGQEYELGFFLQNNLVRKGKVSIPKEVLLSNPTLEGGFQDVRIGETIRVRMQDPLTSQIREVVLTGVGEEPIRLFEAEEAVVGKHVRMEADGLELNAWLDERGRVLRQELPFAGLLLEASSSSDAIRIGLKTGLQVSQLVETGGTSSSMMSVLEAITP